MPVSNLDLTLFTAADAYLALGYSVIPLRGEADPDRPKVAAVEWGVCQLRRATPAELRSWFVDKAYRAVGIVTGSISRLAVLDFDDEDLFKRFRAEYPDLAERLVIKTRRGYHIYLHVPPHLRLQGQKLRGLELLWEGRYVVARPSVINGHAYKLLKGGQPKELSEYDFQRITRFFDSLEAAQQSLEQARTAVPTLPAPAQPLTADDLPGLYTYLVRKIGSRNEALFQTCLQARDSGVGQTEVVEALLGRFVKTLANTGQRHETPVQRRGEALATIASAYSRPPRQQTGVSFRHRFLPNSVREYCDEQGNTAFVRVFNALRLDGVMPGKTFTRHQLLKLLKNIVGRDSIDKALNTIAPDGQRVFVKVTSLSGLSLVPKGTARQADPAEHQNCVLDRVQKSGKIQKRRGRQQSVYVLPGNGDLCQMFGVPLTGSDPVTWDDLTSAKKTRQASLRELIARRPGKYPRRWLAKRLGVCIRTLHSYLKELKIRVTATFTAWKLTWGTLGVIPYEDMDIKGSFLEDERGKRFPPIRALAARLLAQGRAVIYKRQGVNDYRLGDAPEAAVAESPRTLAAITLMPTQSIPDKAYRLASVRPTASDKSYPTVPSVTLPDKAYHIQPPLLPLPSAQAPILKRNIKRRYKRPLADAQHEALAQRVYQVINGRTTEKAHRISLTSSRRCVNTYGPVLIERTLKRLERRNNLTKPVGFFMTLLRVEGKFSRAG